MKMSFRWYGKSDPVRLEYIRQIPGMHGIVSALYDVAVGDVWPLDKILALKNSIEDHGLAFEVVESVPVHEDIKLGKPSRDLLIANYCETIMRLASSGIKVVCYNFMPVFDWTRTTLDLKLPDGSTCLAFDVDMVSRIDVSKGISLPGWDTNYTREQLRSLLDQYTSVGEEQLSQARGPGCCIGGNQDGDSSGRPTAAHLWLAPHRKERGRPSAYSQRCG